LLSLTLIGEQKVDGVIFDILINLTYHVRLSIIKAANRNLSKRWLSDRKKFFAETGSR
jgi:hypothetical protein